MGKRKCRACGGAYQHPAQGVPKPTNSTIYPPVCSLDCLIEYSHTLKKKAYRKTTRNLKTKMLGDDKGHWRKKARVVFQKLIRLRDESDSCISCKESIVKDLSGGSFDAGHYVSVARNDALMFSFENCHKQCVQCNRHQSGNLIEYRKRLVVKIGIERVEWLEGHHENPRYRVDDYKAVYAISNHLIKSKQITDPDILAGTVAGEF
ncbi:recombination protein NinG [Candidatus Venteria ishoeyi]|uniref:Bacteriophage Lambda NinG protein n=1 Tax=Candidatus Venteria ishoeyi TaxID=1899563 RepID=A0A1H6F5G6_9GAMM|nr:recombination protein NinG [Candidatus Venteria ishoeyi]SEH05342.1 Bacteriophage Lambda NinG protein [Candidatus Venteria ishoeyi]